MKYIIYDSLNGVVSSTFYAFNIRLEKHLKNVQQKSFFFVRKSVSKEY